LIFLPGHPIAALFSYTTLFRSPISRRDRSSCRSVGPTCTGRHGVDPWTRTQKERYRMKNGIFTYAWDLEAEGYDTAIARLAEAGDRKSTRLNSSHVSNSYAVFC